jgi:hypothetical protein
MKSPAQHGVKINTSDNSTVFICLQPLLFRRDARPVTDWH